MVFYTEGFLSKWGLQDGDILDDLLFEEFGFIEDLDFEHDVLIEVVENHVLPKIENKFEYLIIGSIHNPIRFDVVDGKEVDNYNSEKNSVEIRPEKVEVADYVIIDIARKRLKKNGS